MRFIESSSWQHKPTSKYLHHRFFPEWPIISSSIAIVAITASSKSKAVLMKLSGFKGSSVHGAGITRNPKRVIEVDPFILVTEAHIFDL